MEDADLSKLQATKAIYMNLIDLAWPETLLISANKNLHMIYEAPYHKDPSRMDQWSKEDIKADFETLFTWIRSKYEAAASQRKQADQGNAQAASSAQGQGKPPSVQGDASQA